jgi:predicted NAD/FAD-binding protein
MNAQSRLSEIRGKERVWYTRCYVGYGFNEDAPRDTVELAERSGVISPWLSSAVSRAAGSVS